MANGRPGRPKKIGTENTTDNIPENTETIVEYTAKPTTESQVSARKKLKLDDNVSLLVSSNIFGELIYINHKTGDKYTWENMGDVQSLYVSDIRAMKSNQRKFLEQNWIVIDGIADTSDDYEGVDVTEIYEALQISNYYKNFLCPSNLNDVFNWSVDDIRNKVPKMPVSTRETIAIRANELIKAGIIDSIAKVKVLEEVIGCELASEDDD
jgi:hypothetical protein